MEAARGTHGTDWKKTLLTIEMRRTVPVLENMQMWRPVGSGRCACDQGYAGEACQLFACPNGCSRHGVCTDGACSCDEGWEGEDWCAPAIAPRTRDAPGTRERAARARMAPGRPADGVLSALLCACGQLGSIV